MYAIRSYYVALGAHSSFPWPVGSNQLILKTEHGHADNLAWIEVVDTGDGTG